MLASLGARSREAARKRDASMAKSGVSLGCIASKGPPRGHPLDSLFDGHPLIPTTPASNLNVRQLPSGHNLRVSRSCRTHQRSLSDCTESLRPLGTHDSDLRTGYLR